MKLQTDCIKIIEEEYHGYVVKVISASRSGVGDLLCCIQGYFYLFEIKGEGDTERSLQRANINATIRAGGRACFIRSVHELRQFIDTGARGRTYAELTKERLKL